MSMITFQQKFLTGTEIFISIILRPILSSRAGENQVCVGGVALLPLAGPVGRQPLCARGLPQAAEGLSTPFCGQVPPRTR